MSVITEEVAEAERQAEADDCAATISKLAIHCKLLAAGAKRDPMIAQELKNLESERTAAEDRLAQLIREQREERLSAEATAQAEAERRAEHLSNARRLAVERQKLAVALDSSLAAFASLLRDYHETARQQTDELMNAGGRMAADAARPKARRINAALRAALIAADVPTAAIDLPHLSGGRIESLTAGDVVAIEPTA